MAEPGRAQDDHELPRDPFSRWWVEEFGHPPSGHLEARIFAACRAGWAAKDKEELNRVTREFEEHGAWARAAWHRHQYELAQDRTSA